MVRSPLFSLVFIALFSACSDKPTLQLTARQLSEQELPGCTVEDCPKLTLSYMLAEGNSESAQKINATIKNEIIKALYIGPEEQPSQPATVEAAMQQFVNTYQLHLAEFPDMPSQYSADISLEVLNKTDEILSMSVSQYLYTGGAHGNGQTYFLNFMPESGQLLDTADLVIDIGGFKDLVERRFRETYDIPLNGSINATGFWFDNDRFVLPKTIGFAQEELIIIYNPYEIASYADGPIELRVPLADVQPYLSE